MPAPHYDSTLAYSPEELAIIANHSDSKEIGLHISSKCRHAIQSRLKIKHKLPGWYKIADLVYPASISLEQCSSEETAKFKSSLFTGNSFIDLTTGFGVDSYYLSQSFTQGYLIEQNESLVKVVSHNFHLLKQDHVDIQCNDALSFIQQTTLQVDLIYMDPARRSSGGNKTVKLEDYEPNILAWLDKLLSISKHLLIKTSPLLDIHLASQQLKHLKKVYVVSLNNECKELLFHIEKGFEGSITIEAVQLGKIPHTFSFQPGEESDHMATFAEPQNYIYEPNPSILKAGAFKLVGLRYQLHKLHPHTHLYTHEQFNDNFPGRCFQVKAICKVQKKELQQLLPLLKANVLVRNFPEKADQIQKRLQIKDGGDDYVIATTDLHDKKLLLVCSRLY